MKKHLGRELIWLCLPVALVAGAALYRTLGARSLSLGNPFDPGPLRLDYTSWQPLDVTPLDVSKGFSWGARTQVQEAGTGNLPSTWKDGGMGNQGDTRDLRVVYRIGSRWKTAPHPARGGALVSTVLYWSTKQSELKVNLETVPRDAEEVRLRGRFSSVHMYRGLTPSSWKSSQSLHVEHYGLNHFVTVESKPFDVPIKTGDETRPDPQVSRLQKIDVVEGKWLRDMFGEVLMVRFRAKPGADFPDEFKCYVEDVHYFDANGHELRVFQDAKSSTPAGIQGSMREWVSPQLPADEEVVRLMQSDAQPSGGWGRVKMPVTISGSVSDGSCWPTPFRVQVRPESGEPRNYGGPKSRLSPSN